MSGDIFSERHIAIQIIYLLFSTMIIISNSYDNKNQDKASRLVTIVFRLFIVKVGCTLCRLIFHKYGVWQNLNIICTFGEFALPIPILVLYIDYIKEIVSIKSIIPTRLIRVAKLLCLSILPLAIASIFYPLVFVFIDGKYQEGPLINVYNGLFVVVLALLYAVVIKCKKGLTKSEFYFLQLYMLAPIIGAILQVQIDTEFNFINLGIIIGMMTVYINIHMDRRRRLIMNEKEMMDSKVDIMMSQIQPHFLYNSLNSIYHLCDQNPDRVGRAIHELAEYMRENFESIKINYPVPFEKELAHIKTYLSLEKMRFDDELIINYDIETTNFMVPSLSIQPIIENAVKHGLGQKEDGGILTLRVREYSDYFEINIIDDGVGFDVTQDKHDGRSHIGMENVKYRLHIMMNAIVYVDSKIDVGTTVTIKIPNKNILVNT